MTIMPQKNPEGSLKAFIGTVRDLSGKKPDSSSHADREPFVRSRADTLPDYIVVCDGEGKILYINPAVVNALGYDEKTITGTPLLSYVADESREFMAARMAGYDTGEVPLYEISLLTQDGLSRSVMVKSKPILYDNHPATLLFLIDITRRKVLEDQLAARAAELLKISTAFQQANKKLTLLSTITRHDINNQLTVLIGYLGLLVTEQPDPTLTADCQKAVTAAGRIRAMIQFTREYEDIGITAPAWQEVRALVETASKEAPLGQVVVQNDLPAGAEVFADSLIVKVFYNLMDNAVRDGGKSTTIRFSVQESGDDRKGVVVGEKEKIFDRGFGKNTGLGLALSREILSITGITITENGVPGTGARFGMVVPAGTYRSAGQK